MAFVWRAIGGTDLGLLGGDKWTKNLAKQFCNLRSDSRWQRSLGRAWKINKLSGEGAISFLVWGSVRQRDLEKTWEEVHQKIHKKIEPEWSLKIDNVFFLNSKDRHHSECTRASAVRQYTLWLCEPLPLIWFMKTHSLASNRLLFKCSVMHRATNGFVDKRADFLS